jgi:hypothetical protein
LQTLLLRTSETVQPCAEPPQITVIVLLPESHDPVHPVRASVPTERAAPVKVPSFWSDAAPLTAPGPTVATELKVMSHVACVMHWGALALRSEHPWLPLLRIDTV